MFEEGEGSTITWGKQEEENDLRGRADDKNRTLVLKNQNKGPHLARKECFPGFCKCLQYFPKNTPALFYKLPTFL